MHSQADWIEAFTKLIDQYKGKKHVLDYKNIYQILVMVVLSAQDSDAKVNGIAPALFKAFPNMQALSKASTGEIVEQIKSVRGHLKKAAWLQEIAQTLKSDKNIPQTMAELTNLKGIGRKSANVILRAANAPAEGILVDLHVVRVAPRLGVTKNNDATKIEKDLMDVLPQEMWGDVGMSISFLGRDICRPTNPKHSECVMNYICDYCKLHTNQN